MIAAMTGVPGVFRTIVDAITGESAAQNITKAGTQTVIRGTAQATRSGGELTTHGVPSERIANEMAASGKYESVHLNRTVSSITDGEIRSGVRPDVAGVRRGGGKVDTVEVLSRRQTAAQMENKISKALGQNCGTIRCVNPD